MSPSSRIIHPSSDLDDDVLIKVDNVSKKFCRDFKKSLWYGLKDTVSDIFHPSKGCSASQEEDPSSLPPLRPGEFWANQNVSFEVKRGECLGLIGHNGAGKTTLLKMLNGLIKPDTGSIEMRGRIGALIALGAGFNPILTGRENIYVNGSILGLHRKEIEDKLDGIVNFAEIEDAIDAPVRTYSSGMQVRLGFAVATAMNPDILILDEVLAVGDASFRHKCYDRIHEIMKDCAVIIVSHSMEQIGAVAKSVGLMSSGLFNHYLSPIDGISEYNQAMESNRSEGADGGKVFEVYSPFVSASVEILTPRVLYGEALEVLVKIDSMEVIDELEFSFSAMNDVDQFAMAWNLSRRKGVVRLAAGKSEFSFKIEPLQLHDGRYRWCLWIGEKGAIKACLYAMRAGEFVVASSFKPLASIPYLPPPTEFEITYH